MVWYYFMNCIVSLALSFTFRKRTAHNKENIPKKDPVIFVANHQNGLVDAIMIPTMPMQEVYFITRADVFKNPIVGRFLRSINMIPIYRLRDGRDKMAKNTEILEYCADLLVEGKKIQMFPEGNHNEQRRVRSFKKGFADIAFLALAKQPDLPIKIVPVGINYDTKNDFAASVALYYGQPIDARDYYRPEDLKDSSAKLTLAAREAVKKLTTHIESKDTYDEKIKELENEGINFLNPRVANQLIEKDNFKGGQALKKQKTLVGFIIYYIFTVLNIFPLLLWWKFKKGIKDRTFVSTFRFVFVFLVFPLFYLIVGGVLAHFWGNTVGLAYLAGSILLGYLRKRLPYWY